MTKLEYEAKIFAEKAHAGQVRKYTNRPYITHPSAVVTLVKTVPHVEAMLAAAWLHDVVEDTPTRIEDIASVFGPSIALLVENLTDVSTLDMGNRKTRKRHDLAHTAQAYPAAKTIKLADIIDNTRLIVDHDPQFARIYLKEKMELLNVLTDGDPSLYSMAMQKIYEAEQKLKGL